MVTKGKGAGKMRLLLFIFIAIFFDPELAAPLNLFLPYVAFMWLFDFSHVYLPK
jgi:hypothetical protein